MIEGVGEFEPPCERFDSPNDFEVRRISINLKPGEETSQDVRQLTRANLLFLRDVKSSVRF
jgi:hypothetical protein